MAKQKPSVMDSLLRQSGSFSAYNKAISLYEKYGKEKNESRRLKIKDELQSVVNDALESLQRLVNVYTEVDKDVTEAIKKNKEDFGEYRIDERSKYLTAITGYLEKMKQIKAELEGQVTAPFLDKPPLLDKEKETTPAKQDEDDVWARLK